MRLTLLEMNYFAGPAHVPMTAQIHFDKADEHFRSWLKANRVSCSQPPFRPSMVPCSCCAGI